MVPLLLCFNTTRFIGKNSLERLESGMLLYSFLSTSVKLEQLFGNDKTAIRFFSFISLSGFGGVNSCVDE